MSQPASEPGRFKCSICGELKLPVEFVRQAKSKRGFTAHCRECHKLKCRIFRAEGTSSSRDTPAVRERVQRARAMKEELTTPETFERITSITLPILPWVNRVDQKFGPDWWKRP